MVDPRRRKQQGLAEIAEIARLAGEDDPAQPFGERRAAGLPGDDDLAGMGAQGGGEPANLGRFASALAALESDETTLAQ